MAYCSKFLNKAAMTSDPIERLKLVATNWFSGINISMSQVGKMSPINPILGETCQRIMPDGTRFYAEQTTHHPPVFNFEIEGPKEAHYIYRGFFEYKGGLIGMNTAKGFREGKDALFFPDGGIIVCEEPSYLEVGGTMVGQTVGVYRGRKLFKDEQNMLELEIIFNPDAKAMVWKMADKFKIWKKKEEKTLEDYSSLTVYQVSNQGKDKVPICRGEGSYIEWLDWEGKRYWTFGDPHDEWEVPNDLLPSDVNHRTDKPFLEQHDFEKAQIEKDRLENLQRNDKKLRTEAEARRK